MLDFPTSPSVGTKYPQPAIAGVPVYTWDGEKWTAISGNSGGGEGGSGGGASVTISTTPPPSPRHGDLWYENDSGITFVYLDDGSSAQWVALTALTSTTPVGSVRYDEAQGLTEAQKAQGRTNIAAAPLDSLAYNGLQINGCADISQELGVTGRGTNGYFCDGWQVAWFGTGISLSGATPLAPDFPAFPHLQFVTVNTAKASLGTGDYAMTMQVFEGIRTARLCWAKPSAAPITIGFWSAHNPAGLYCGAIRNVAATRSYVFTYTQVAASVPQYNVVTIPGDTAGAWPVDNTGSLTLAFTMAAGSAFTAASPNTWVNGNYLTVAGQVNGVASTGYCLRITGVIVVPGLQVPSAERSPFIARSTDQELVLCRRYFQWAGINLYVIATGANQQAWDTINFSPPMRALPTMSAMAADPTSNTGASMQNVVANGWQQVSPNSAGLYLTSTAAGPSFMVGYRSSADARF